MGEGFSPSIHCHRAEPEWKLKKIAYYGSKLTCRRSSGGAGRPINVGSSNISATAIAHAAGAPIRGTGPLPASHRGTRIPEPAIAGHDLAQSTNPACIPIEK